ncbi:glycosyltransferase [Curtobacterium sp. VKM Ac-1395]|uniref:glycosyltransferase family 4 protein n=1 Tax=Curtobacterium sp. VKM Ac-1395 TaxID=2783815 RepID=UPI002B27A33C|nr:glycosyltransferase [Curtobacterium sp. VKM Ac-1395]
MNSSNRDVVLLTAFACDPRLPSEPTIGWEYLLSWLTIADERDLQVVAVMNERSRVATIARLEEIKRDVSRLILVSPAEPRYLRFLHHHRLTRLEHMVWAWRVPAAVRATIDTTRVVLARHVTFASELLAPPITWLPATTYAVWGPVGSTGRADAYLFAPRPADWRKRYVIQRLRDFISRKSARRVARQVDLTLTTSNILAEVVRSVGARAEVFPNTRPIRPPDTDARRTATSGALRLLCVGNLVPLKRFELAIAALSVPELADATLRIAGKPAPGRPNELAALARELGVDERVRFLGQIPREAVVTEMIAADVLIHLSAREGGSGVVGEATAVGLPVVVFAGTGAAAVLEFADAPGVAIGREEPRTSASVAEAVTAAALLPRDASTVWTETRLIDEERVLLDRAVALRSAK